MPPKPDTLTIAHYVGKQTGTARASVLWWKFLAATDPNVDVSSKELHSPALSVLNACDNVKSQMLFRHVAWNDFCTLYLCFKDNTNSDLTVFLG